MRLPSSMAASALSHLPMLTPKATGGRIAALLKRQLLPLKARTVSSGLVATPRIVIFNGFTSATNTENGRRCECGLITQFPSSPGSLQHCFRHHRDQLFAKVEPVLQHRTAPEFRARPDSLFHQQDRDSALLPQKVGRVARFVADAKLLVWVETCLRDQRVKEPLH